MSSKSDVEFNSIVIPALGAALFCAAMVLLRLFGPEGEPEEVGPIENAALLRSFAGQTPEDGFGRSVLAGLDLDGDAAADLVVGGPAAPGGGYIQAFSGRDGRPLWPRVAAPEGSAYFGAAMAFLPDRDGDGIAEILVGAPGGGAGAAFLISGGSGEILMTIAGRRRAERFGFAVAALDDVDGDRIPDFAVGAPGDDQRSSAGCVRLLSGRDGSVMIEIEARPNRLGDRFGFSLTALRDLDGDGAAELAVGAPGDNLGGYRAGSVSIHSTRGGELRRRLDGDGPGQGLGHAVSGCGDRDGDGADDLLVSAYDPTGRGYVLLVSGATGQVVRRFEDGEGNGLGASLAACGDIDGDGVPDLAVGAPAESRKSRSWVGAVHLFSGRDGAVIGRIAGDRERSGFGHDVAYLGDLYGDGRQVFLVGAQHRAVLVASAPKEGE